MQVGSILHIKWSQFHSFLESPFLVLDKRVVEMRDGATLFNPNMHCIPMNMRGADKNMIRCSDHSEEGVHYMIRGSVYFRTRMKSICWCACMHYPKKVMWHFYFMMASFPSPFNTALLADQRQKGGCGEASRAFWSSDLLVVWLISSARVFFLLLS